MSRSLMKVSQIKIVIKQSSNRETTNRSVFNEHTLNINNARNQPLIRLASASNELVRWYKTNLEKY